MYPGITLCPGGAFVMCESVGEFDDNVQYPEPQEESTKVLSDAECLDPVTMAITKLAPIYERSIAPLMSMEYSFDSPDDGIKKLDFIANAMSDGVNTLLREIGKQTGMLRLAHNSTDFSVQAFTPHIGYFMKNASKVKQQGIEHYQCTYSAIPAFENRWGVNNIVKVMTTLPEIMDNVIFSSSLAPVCDCDMSGLTDTFDGMVDLLNCVYRNPDRLHRLEAPLSRNISFTNLLRGQVDSADEDNRPVRYEDEFAEKTSRRYFNAAACYLKCVSQKCYQMQCQLSDGTLSSEAFVNAIPALLANCVNVFAIGTILLMHVSTCMREYCAMKKAIDDYTNLLLTTLKTV